MNNPLVHRGFSVSTVQRPRPLTPPNTDLDPREKDAMNALMIGMNNIGVLAKSGHLSMELVEDFCEGLRAHVRQPLAMGLIQIFMMVNVSKTDEGSESIWAGLFWLLDTLEGKRADHDVAEVMGNHPIRARTCKDGNFFREYEKAPIYTLNYCREPPKFMVGTVDRGPANVGGFGKKFADEVMPNAEEWDRNGVFPQAIGKAADLVC